MVGHAAPFRPSTQSSGDGERPQNTILRSLPDGLWQAWQPLFEYAELGPQSVLYEPGDPFHYVYFPLDCVLSTMNVLADGACVQVAVIGPEGLLGIPVFLGGGVSRTRTVVQCPGMAARIPATFVATEFQRDASLQHLLLRYTQALIAQMSQTAVCNRHHTPEQQFCRWLLLSLDRMHGSELPVTHEFVASMLGVRRETVSEAVRRLQAQGAIHSRRGHLDVADRGALEHASCECYDVVTAEYRRLLPQS